MVRFLAGLVAGVVLSGIAVAIGDHAGIMHQIRFDRCVRAGYTPHICSVAVQP